MSGADGWRPIAKAPLDKSVFIGWWADGVWHERFAWWDAEFDYRADGETGVVGYVGAWTNGTVASWYMEECKSFRPTHYRLPPAAPPPPRRPSA